MGIVAAITGFIGQIELLDRRTVPFGLKLLDSLKKSRWSYFCFGLNSSCTALFGLGKLGTITT